MKFKEQYVQNLIENKVPHGEMPVRDDDHEPVTITPRFASRGVNENLPGT